MTHTNLDRTTFAACQAYDNAGNPVKPMRNVLAELAYSARGGKMTLAQMERVARPASCGIKKDSDG